MSIFNEDLHTEEIYNLPGKVTVIIPQAWETLSSDELMLLKKILQSVKLNLEAVTILSMLQPSFEKLKHLSPSRVISFTPLAKPEIKSYENTSVDGTLVIQSDPLHALDDAKKKSLWLALKQMFGI